MSDDLTVPIPRFNSRGKVGRKPKAEVEARISKTGPKTAEEKMKIARFNAIILLSTNVDKIARKTLDIAMDDKHPGQMAAIKMLMNRMYPEVEPEKKHGGGQTVNITIETVGGPQKRITMHTGAGDIPQYDPVAVVEGAIREVDQEDDDGSND